MLKKLWAIGLLCLLPYLQAHAEKISLGTFIKNVISSISGENNEKPEGTNEASSDANASTKTSEEAEKYYRLGKGYAEKIVYDSMDSEYSEKTDKENARLMRQAEQALVTAAKLNHVEAQYELGMLYFNAATGFLTQTEPYKKMAIERSIFWLEKAATAGNPKAQSQLGWVLYYIGSVYNAYSGHCSPAEINDKQKAVDWLLKAASQKNASAFDQLGSIYYQKDHCPPFKQDYKKAFEAFTAAAQLGNHDSLYSLAGMYEQGEYVKKDPKKAFQLKQELLKLEPEHQGVACDIARAYEEGKVVKRDIKKAKALMSAYECNYH